MDQPFYPLALADVGTSFALVLGAIGTFIGTLGGVARFVQWLINRSDRNRQQAIKDAREAPTLEARRLSDSVEWLERRNRTLEAQLDAVERDNDTLRSKLRQAADDLDEAIERDRKHNHELEELRTECHRLERQSKRK